MKPEQKLEQNACCMNCGNNNCCHNDFHGNSPKYLLLRWLLAMLIMVITFAIGFKLGEFKQGYFGNFRGSPDIMRYRHGENVYPPFIIQDTKTVAPTESLKAPVK